MIAPLLLLVLTRPVPAPAPLVAATSPRGAAARCCLTNTAYRGVCVVTLGEKETCESVLAYLNAPNTAGRTYCNSTRLRGGWEIVPCPPAAPQPSTVSAQLGGEAAACAAIVSDPLR
jgi:hypothetical protein